jgi:arabinose-5-phosphate isomerase
MTPQERQFVNELFDAMIAFTRRLHRVMTIQYHGDQLPLVSETTSIKDALFEITAKRLGVTGVIDATGNLTGIITDGDLRRGLERRGEIFYLKTTDLMSRNPKTTSAAALAAEAVAIMEQYSITSLFVLDHGTQKPIGVIHLHDLIKAGIVP